MSETIEKNHLPRIDRDRVKARMKQKGYTQKSLADVIGVSQAAIAKIASGQIYGSKHLEKIARELQTTTDYLTGQISDPAAGALPEIDPQQIAQKYDSFAVPELLISPDMITRNSFPVSDETPTIFLPRNWLAQFVSSEFDNLFACRTRSLAMSPTFGLGDIALVDTAQRVLDRQDCIWAIIYGGLGMVRRLRCMADDSVLIICDSDETPNMNVPACDIALVGRVVWSARNL